MELLDETGGNRGHPRSGSEQRPDDGAAVAVVAADVRVGDDASFEIGRVFPREVKRSREGVGDVAGGAHAMADDDFIGFARPLVGLALREPIGAVPEDRFAEIGPGEGVAEDSCEGVASGEDFVAPMGQRDMLPHCGADGSHVRSEACAQDAHMRETADVDVAAGALSRSDAAGVCGEKVPVILFHVSVAMLPRGEHEGDVAREVISGVVTAVRDERFRQHFCELQVERVFPGAEELMIVNAALAPILRLLAEDVAALVQWRVFGAPEDAVGMRVFRCQVVAHDAVVTLQCGAVVIPMNRHRERIADQGTPRGSGALIGG